MPLYSFLFSENDFYAFSFDQVDRGAVRAYPYDPSSSHAPEEGRDKKAAQGARLAPSLPSSGRIW